mmetsp:Transcript_80202/g.227082  ORF Transcript_80202/g.227082 Transcript_80202/m.227082 type:complete len:122 (-) Transcript_80202:8-373(-)
MSAAADAAEANIEAGNGAREEADDLAWSQYICHGILNRLAAVGRAVVLCCAHICRCFRVSVYPLKEMFFEFIDAWDRCIHPYKKRTPIHESTFKYNAVSIPNSRLTLLGSKGDAIRPKSQK